MAASLNSSAVVNAAAPRVAPRQRLSVPARLTWKDNSGAVRFASVTTRDVSETGAFVECASQAPIPLFRLVHLQLEAANSPVPTQLQGTRTLAAVWRVETPRTKLGAPSGYALRFLVEPARQTAVAAPYAPHTMAVAS